MTEKVKIGTLGSDKTTEIPATELAPGMIQTRVVGSADDVFVKHSDLRPNDSETTPVLPDGFEPIALVVLGVLRPWLRWVKTDADWIGGFRRDKHPVTELSLWMRLCISLQAMTHGGRDGPAVAADVFRLLVQTMSNGKHALQTTELKRISRARAKTVVQHYLGIRKTEFIEHWVDQVDMEAFVAMWNAEAE